MKKGLKKKIGISLCLVVCIGMLSTGLILQAAAGPYYPMKCVYYVPGSPYIGQILPPPCQVGIQGPYVTQLYFDTNTGYHYWVTVQPIGGGNWEVIGINYYGNVVY
jgi:hypothetical protein